GDRDRTHARESGRRRRMATVNETNRARLAAALGLPTTATQAEVLEALRKHMLEDEQPDGSVDMGGNGDADERAEMAELIEAMRTAHPSLSWSAAYAKVAAEHVVLAERVGSSYKLGELSTKAPARPSTHRELLERAGFAEAEGGWQRSDVHGLV